MTWHHVACICAALGVVVACVMNRVCQTDAMKDVVGLCGIVIAAVMGHAGKTENSRAPKKPKAKSIRKPPGKKK